MIKKSIVFLKYYRVPILLSSLFFLILLISRDLIIVVVSKGDIFSLILWFLSWIILFSLFFNIMYRILIFIQAWISGTLDLSAFLEPHQVQSLRKKAKTRKQRILQIQAFFALLLVLLRQLGLLIWNSLYTLVFPVIKWLFRVMRKTHSPLLTYLERYPFLIKIFSSSLVIFAIGFLVFVRI